MSLIDPDTNIESGAGLQPKPTSPIKRVVVGVVSDKLGLVGVIICAIMVLAAIFAPWIAPQNPYDLAQLDIMDNRMPPGEVSFSGVTYLLGTDDQGRDLFSAAHEPVCGDI